MPIWKRIGELIPIIKDYVEDVYFPVFENKIGDLVNIKEYRNGLEVGNNASKPLSKYFITLKEAQTIFPFATSLEDELDGLVIQKAINENPNKTIFIPDGNYIINTPIKIGYNQKMTGMSMNDTVLTYTADSGSLIDISGKNHIDIENMSLLHSFEIGQMGASNTAKAINSIACSYTRYKNIIIKGFDYGIDFSNNAWCSDIDNITTQSCNYGIFSNGEFNNCSILKYRSTYCKTGAFVGAGRTITFTDCQFELCEVGVHKVNLGDLNLRGCYFERNIQDISVNWGISIAYKVSIVDCSFFKNEQMREGNKPAIYVHGDKKTLVLVKNCQFTKYNLDQYAIIEGYPGTKANILLEDNYIQDNILIVPTGVLIANLVIKDSFNMNPAYNSYKHSHSPRFVTPDSSNKVYLDGKDEFYRTYCENDVEIYLPETNENCNSFEIVVSLSAGKSVTIKSNPNATDTINNAVKYTNNTGSRQYLIGKIIHAVKHADRNEYILVWFNEVV